VRELENAVRHACTFAEGGVVTNADLPARVVARATPAGAAGGSAYAISNHSGRSLKGFLREMEKAFILQTLADCEGDKDRAARALKVSLATLYRKLPEPG
jgi:two-component system response regulator AtoC